ncbi:hypothetical protein ACFLTH_17030, partial [Bacteroidota bacterium]
MAKLDIAPPPPPKFSKVEKPVEKSEKEETEVPLKEPEPIEVSDTPKKKGFFKNIFGRKEKSEEEKIEEPSENDEFDLEKIRADFGIPSKEEKQTKTESKVESKVSEVKPSDDAQKLKVSDIQVKPKQSKKEKKAKKKKEELVEVPEVLKEEVSELVKEEEQEEFDKKVEPVNWADGDVVDEYHDAKEDAGSWIAEEPEALKSPVKSKKSVSKEKLAVKKVAKKVKPINAKPIEKRIKQKVALKQT